MKRYFALLVLLSQPLSYAGSLVWSPVATGSDGKILIQTQADAIQYCAKKGMRLATLREWYGALKVDLRETQYPDVVVDENEPNVLDPRLKAETDAMDQAGYTLVLHIVRTGSSKYASYLYFYVNLTAYVPPTPSLGNHAYWTSECVSHRGVGASETDCLIIDAEAGMSAYMDAANIDFNHNADAGEGQATRCVK